MKKPSNKKSAPRKSPPLETQFQQALEQAKLDAMKELAYGASHEINNPLANISTRAQTLLKLETDPEKRRMLAAIHAQAMRAHEMIADLMLFARPPALNRARFDLGSLLEKLMVEMTPQAVEQRTELTLSKSTAPIEIDADATQLAVSIRAVIQNSLEALGTEGRVEVSATLSGSTVTITVTDTGPGISPEILPHIFEPFYSGREAGRGLGFGLSKCWRIVTDHGGTVEVSSQCPHGANFRLILPSLASGQKAH